MSEATIRAFRTLLQASAAEVVISFVEAFAYDFNDAQYKSLYAMLLLMITLGQNYLEEETGQRIGERKRK